MKTMYEINWHQVNDTFTHCTVTPIEVIREGVLPGCSLPSITARDANGRKFQGSPCNYFLSEAEAWSHVKSEIQEAIASRKRNLAQQEAELKMLETYLEAL